MHEGDPNRLFSYQPNLPTAFPADMMGSIHTEHLFGPYDREMFTITAENTLNTLPTAPMLNRQTSRSRNSNGGQLAARTMVGADAVFGSADEIRPFIQRNQRAADENQASNQGLISQAYFGRENVYGPGTYVQPQPTFTPLTTTARFPGEDIASMGQSFPSATSNGLATHVRVHSLSLGSTSSNISLESNPSVFSIEMGRSVPVVGANMTAHGIATPWTSPDLGGGLPSPETGSSQSFDGNGGFSSSRVENGNVALLANSQGSTCLWVTSRDRVAPHITCRRSFRTPQELHRHICDVHLLHARAPFHCCWDGCRKFKSHDYLNKAKVQRHLLGHAECKCYSQSSFLLTS
jgi:hypothetical protein